MANQEENNYFPSVAPSTQNTPEEIPSSTIAASSQITEASVYKPSMPAMQPVNTLPQNFNLPQQDSPLPQQAAASLQGWDVPAMQPKAVPTAVMQSNINTNDGSTIFNAQAGNMPPLTVDSAVVASGQEAARPWTPANTITAAAPAKALPKQAEKAPPQLIATAQFFIYLTFGLFPVIGIFPSLYWAFGHKIPEVIRRLAKAMLWIHGIFLVIVLTVLGVWVLDLSMNATHVGV